MVGLSREGSYGKMLAEYRSKYVGGGTTKFKNENSGMKRGQKKSLDGGERKVPKNGHRHRTARQRFF